MHPSAACFRTRPRWGGIRTALGIENGVASQHLCLRFPRRVTYNSLPSPFVAGVSSVIAMLPDFGPVQIIWLGLVARAGEIAGDFDLGSGDCDLGSGDCDLGSGDCISGVCLRAPPFFFFSRLTSVWEVEELSPIFIRL